MSRKCQTFDITMLNVWYFRDLTVTFHSLWLVDY